MRKIIPMLAVLAASLLVPALASAAAGTYGASFDFNSSAPTFNPGPTLPVVPVSVTYNPAGTLTLTESGGSPSWWADDGALENGEPDWPNVGFTITGPHGAKGFLGQTEPSDSPGLQVGGVRGYLPGSIVETGDTITRTYTSPLIVDEPWSYVQIVVQDPKGDISEHQQSGYFPGAAPVVQLPKPRSVADHADEYDEVTLNAPSVTGIALGDPGYGSRPKFTVAGLPPGLHSSCGRVSCELSGTPTRAGAYTVSLSASLDGASASSSFHWHVAPAPLPEVVTDLSSNDGITRRPAVIGISGDGSWWFGGSTGHEFERRTSALRNLGSLRWTIYTAQNAQARGVIWGLYGPGPLASDRLFQREGVVEVHEYRPVRGVFTREVITANETFREHVTPHQTKLVHYHLHDIVKPQHTDGRWYP